MDKSKLLFDEMWTYVGSRRKGKRRSVWVWTAVVEEVDGSRWVDFEVGDRSEATFLKLYERLPDAECYRSDAYRVYEWLNRHKVGKGSEVNRNEGLHSVLVEETDAKDERLLQECAAGFYCIGLPADGVNPIPIHTENTANEVKWTNPSFWDSKARLVRLIADEAN